MLVDIVLGSKAVWRVFIVLADAPGQGVTKDEIKKITKLGGNSLFNSIEILLKNKIILKNKFGKKTYYKLNLNNKYNKSLIDIIKLEKEDLNNLSFKLSIILREYVRQLTSIININEIYVFGSAVKNSFREDSDIDIAIITEKELTTKERIEIEKVNEKLKKRFKKEIQPHFFTEEEFKKSKSLLIEQVHRDGIKLV